MDSTLPNGLQASGNLSVVCQNSLPADGHGQLPVNTLPVSAASPAAIKAINQRGCVASLDVSCDDHQSLVLQQPLQQSPAEDRDDGQWEVVSYRRGRHKHDRRNKHQCVGQRGAGTKVSKGAAVSSFTGSTDAEKGRQLKPIARQLSPADNSPVSLAAHVTGSQWQECLRSFAHLGNIKGSVFYNCLMKHQRNLLLSRQASPSARVSRREFVQFQKMMAQGPESITRAQDIFFLAAPFRVLLSQSDDAPAIIFLSLIFEGIVPGFLSRLHECFVNGLLGVSPGIGKTFFTIAEQFALLCQQDERYLERFCWQELPARQRCNLFSFLAFLFKRSEQLDMVRELNLRVSRPWLVEYFQSVVAEVPGKTCDIERLTVLYDLRSALRANFFWLKHQFFEVDTQENRYRWIEEYADLVEIVMDALRNIEVNPREEVIVGVFRAIAQCSVHFSTFLNRHLGYERTINLLNDLLHHIEPLKALSNLAFDLRLRLLEGLLMKCEDLSHKRNCSQLTKTWDENGPIIHSQLENCREFMKCYAPPSNSFDPSIMCQRIKVARLNLQLRESAYYRMCCQLTKTPPAQIQKHVQTYEKVHSEGWKLSQYHKEIGTLELVKWYSLAGKQSEAVDTLLSVPFTQINLCSQKANLLSSFGAYEAANDELRRNKALFASDSPAHRYKRNVLDDRIAMNLLSRYLEEKNTDHLVQAYCLAVDVLGRCQPNNRDRFEGALGHIVNAMKFSGLKFEHFASKTSVLRFLVTEGSCIKSWYHFSNLLHFRHKAGITDARALNKVIEAADNSRTVFLKVVK